MIRIENLIGGDFVSSSEFFDDISPLDGTVIAKIPRTKDVEDAVTAAEHAQSQWSGLSLLQRCDWLDKIADSLE